MIRFQRCIKTVKVTLAAGLMAISQAVLACDMHGGFPGGPMGFGHPPANFFANKQDNNATNIMVSMPTLISGTAGKETTIELSYSLSNPPGDQTVELTITGDESIKFKENVLTGLAGDSGQHSFTFTPTETGTFRLLMTASVNTVKGTKTQKRQSYFRVNEPKT
jgi:hypothetical protein